MSEMVETVAKAIYERMPSDGFTGLARAAIKAMREPTEAMLCAARDWSLKECGKPIGNDDAIGCWTAMLDAALQPEPRPATAGDV